ncbi:hypothetical protein HUJ04_013094 [Dendroctonus ponderosae]|nr:hypothetical protein HUJ04_013094 [Dendroctonus ponderosae]
MDEPSENTVHLDFEDENTVPDGAELAPESSEEVAIEPEPKPFSYIEMLDKPRELQEPMDITADYLKVIAQELGLIKLCWPELTDVTFEDRTNFPDSYLKNSRKEKLLLLYAENFRRQFCCKFPNRKPLFLACDNECGLQVSRSQQPFYSLDLKTLPLLEDMHNRGVYMRFLLIGFPVPGPAYWTGHSWAIAFGLIRT